MKKFRWRDEYGEIGLLETHWNPDVVAWVQVHGTFLDRKQAKKLRKWLKKRLDGDDG